MTQEILVKGRNIDQAKLRKFLEEVDFSNIEKFQTDEGYWKSPITGELFHTKWQLYGQLGAYLRKVERKDPREPTRAGYVRAIRRGMEPTKAQKDAHAQYAKRYRRNRRERLMADRGIEPNSQGKQEVEVETRRVPTMSMD